MSYSEFLHLLDELLELEPGTLKGSEKLAEIGWSSLTLLGFIALADENFGFAVAPAAVVKCKTVEDLTALLGDRLQAAERV